MTSILFKIAAVLTLLVAVSPAARAATVVIDFTQITPGPSDNGVIFIASPYVEDGFQIAGPFLGTIVPTDLNGSPRATFQGSAGLFSANRGAMVLTNVAGDRFNLLSVDFAHSNNPSTPKSLLVTGLTAGGLTVSKTIALVTGPDNTSASSFPGYATLVLGSQFRNLVSASFIAQSTFSSVVVDNITVSRVPLPASLPLLAGALALTAALARRRRAA